MGVRGSGLRDKLAERSRPFLDDGEAVRAVFMARSGLAPDQRTVNPMAVLRGAHNHVVVVTDRSTVVLDATLWRSTRPVRLAERSPQQVVVGEGKGIWTEVTIDRTYWVHKRFRGELDVATARPPTRRSGGGRTAAGRTAASRKGRR